MNYQNATDYPQYNGIYYRYQKEDKPNRQISGVWMLYDKPDMTGRLMTFNADYYRIDQCFDHWFKDNNL